MNCFSAISLMRGRMVGGVIGSRCRSNISALDRVVNLSPAVDEDSVTRCPAGKQTRLISTARDYDNGLKEEEDVGSEKLDYESYFDFLNGLAKFPRARSVEEIKAIYETWCAYNDGFSGSFPVFEEKIRLIDLFNARFPEAKVRLNDECGIPSEQVVKEFINLYPRPIYKRKK